MTPDELLELFGEVVDGVGVAVAALTVEERRAKTPRHTQYALDLAADDAALRVLEKAPVAVVSEESGRGGDPSAPVTVVLDPVDGSTNASRGIPYWATSLAAVDGDGLLAATVANQANSARFTAWRGGGAFRDGVPVAPSAAVDTSDAVVGVTGATRGVRQWPQWRTLGSAALELCEVGAGGLDAYVDAVGRLAPWDYLGALLVCREAGAVVVDAAGRELVTTDPSARRQVVAAGTGELLADVRESLA